MMASNRELVLKPRTGWQALDFRELWQYRELFGILVWRDMQIRYKQTAFGAAWALLQPLAGTLVYGGFFGSVVNMPSDGSPYLLFVYAGLVPWTFISNGIAMSSNSLVGNENMIRKIYFPRLMVPLGSIGALIVDMLVGLAFLALAMLWYRWPVTANILLLPVFMMAAFAVTSGCGLILAALNVRFRDIKYVVPFCMQMLFFLTPVLYPATSLPPRFRLLAGLNPMAGVIEGFRHALLGSPVSWTLMGGSLACSAVLLLAGLLTFNRMDRTFADLI